jgi:WD40 repeat protein
MIKLANENILKLIFNSIVSKLNPLFDKTSNKVIHQVILKTLNYEDIIKTLNAKPILHDCTWIILSMIMLSNGNIVFASADNRLQVWDLINEKCLKSLGEQYVIKYLIALPNDIIVSAPLYGGKIKVRDTKKDYNIIKEINPGFSVSSIILLNSGHIAYAVWESYNTSITIIDCLNNFESIRQLKGHQLSVGALVNISNNKFASACYEIKIWDIVDNDYINVKTLKVLNGHQYHATSLLFDEKYGLLFSCSSCQIDIWELDNNYHCIKTVVSSTGLDKCIVLPGGYFAFGGYGGDIIINSLINFKPVNILKEHEDQVLYMFLLKDKWLISISPDKKLLWNLKLRKNF